MSSKYITIDGITDVINFVHCAAEVDGDVICHKGKYAVDGKSFMGLMSIDISTGITVEYPENAVEFENFISKYV